MEQLLKCLELPIVEDHKFWREIDVLTFGGGLRKRTVATTANLSFSLLWTIATVRANGDMASWMDFGEFMRVVVGDCDPELSTPYLQGTEFHLGWLGEI